MASKYQAYPEYKNSGVEWLEEIPIGWSLFDGKRLFKNRRELSLETDEQLAASQRYGVVPQSLMMQLNDSKVMLALKGTSSFRHVEKDDFVISLRSFEGGIEHSKFIGCVSPAYTVLSATKDIVPGFYRYLFKSNPYIAALQSTTDSLRDGKSITFDQFGAIPLVLPKTDEQETIANFLDHETAKIDTLIDKQQQLIQLLKEKRQAVISHAVTKGLNPNAPMRDSGVEWLGEVPEHWVVMRLSRVGKVGQGCAFSHSIQGQETGELPWFKCMDMNTTGNEELMNNAANYVNHDLVERIGAPIFPSGTVIFPRVGAALLTNKRRILSRPSVVDDNIYAFIPVKADVHFRFIYLFLQLIDMATVCSPGLVPTITFGAVKNIPFPKPSLSEQKEIVEYVDHQTSIMESLIQKAEFAIELMQERRTALISAAVTGKIDVRHPVCHPAGNDTIADGA